MDFFKSVFSNDPDPEEEEEEEEGEGHEDHHQRQQQQVQKEEEAAESKSNPNSNPNSPLSFASVGGFGGGGGGWNLGGLIKTISTKSESVIQTYRRDLEEFSSGLKKETSAIKEVASRAVRDLPGSLEVGASVAQESLETVGQVIDDFGGSVWRGTAEIISQGKEALLAVDSDPGSPTPAKLEPTSSQVRYSRFEAQVLAIQNDASTFVEDAEGFDEWKVGFKLEEKEEEIEGLLYDNGTLEGFFEKFVPEVVDRETFWGRYFYRVYRLKQAEDARAKLVKRVIAGEEEEELSWEVDDDDENDNAAEASNMQVTEEKEETKEESKEEEMKEDNSKVEAVQAEISESKQVEEAQKEQVVEEVGKKEASSEIVEEEKPMVEEDPEVKNSVEVEKVKSSEGDEESSSKAEAKLDTEAKSDQGDSSKDSDFTVVSSQPSVQEEDDLGWDEIEDLGDHEEKKMSKPSGSQKPVDLRKKISVAEDDEDLSWDIEDDED